MVRTTVFIEEADKRALKYEAERLGQSEAELIRRGIKHVLDRPAGIASGLIGIANSGASNSIGDEIREIRKQWAREVIKKKFGDRAEKPR